MNAEIASANGVADTFTVQSITQTEARSLVERIRSHINDARALVLELYEKEGWRALGYDSWRECVVAEFNQSRAHLYRLLDAAKVERNIVSNLETAANTETPEPIQGSVLRPLSSSRGPIPESVLRPLASLEPEQQREAWTAATAKNPKPTAREVKAAVSTLTGVSPEEIARSEEAEREREHRQLSTQMFVDAVSLFDPRIMTVEALASYLLRNIDLKETSADLSKPRLERALEVFKTIVASWK